MMAVTKAPNITSTCGGISDFPLGVPAVIGQSQIDFTMLL
jgi:hypothetical protein